MSTSPSSAPRSTAAIWIGNTILLAWLTYLLVAPTVGFDWIESWHNEQRAAEVVLLAITAIAYCVMRLATRNRDWGGRWDLPALVLAFLVLGLVSAMRAKFEFAALAEVSTIALLALLIMLTARMVSTDVQRYVRWARWFALFFSTAYVLGTATQYFAAVSLGRAIDLDVLILGYANPRFPTALHAVLIPLLALTVLEKTELRLLRAGALVMLSLLWAINLGLGSRGLWFAYAIGVPVTALLLSWRNVKPLFAVLILTAGAGVALYFVLFSIIPILTGVSASVSAPTDNLATVTSRDVLWELSWETIKASPWLGIGPMQFAAFASRVGAHPHNWPLQIAAEWGVPALVLLAIAIFRLCNAVRRTAISGYSIPALTMSVAVALLLGLVDGNLVMPVSQVATALAAGLLIGALRGGEPRPDYRSASATFLSLTLMIGIVASGTLIAFAVTSLPDQARSIEIFQRSHPGAWVVPRFWEQGNLL